MVLRLLDRDTFASTSSINNAFDAIKSDVLSHVAQEEGDADGGALSDDPRPAAWRVEQAPAASMPPSPS